MEALQQFGVCQGVNVSRLTVTPLPWKLCSNTSKSLDECYTLGAARFGRPQHYVEPRSIVKV